MTDVLTDELDRTARQVRLDWPNATIHTVAVTWSEPDLAYGTVCGKALSKTGGAILTTDAATCERCLRGGR